MDIGIIIALIFGFASIITSICFGLVPSIRKERIEKQKKKILTLLKDVDSFYSIESILLDELCAITGKSKDSVKREIRKRVREEKNYSINSMPSSITQEISRYENSQSYSFESDSANLLPPFCSLENLGTGGRCFSCRPSRGFVRNLIFVWQGFHCISPLPTIRRHSVTWAVARRNPRGVRGYQAGGGALRNPCRQNEKRNNEKMVVQVILFIFAGRKHIHYVYLQYMFKRCAG